MRNGKIHSAQQIGFMLGGNPGNVHSNSMTPPTNPFIGETPPPMPGSPPVHPPVGGMVQQPGGLGGLLQGLIGGGRQIDLPGLLTNAQKMLGAINQAGEVFKNISPMLQLLRNLDLNELFSDTSENEQTQEKKPVQKKRVTKKKKARVRKRKKSA